ncbi:alpha-L-glutamate ligase [Streptomyces sp. NPDC048248]|uniref:alpha-L-glutamate ligase n=1 Tax=Streptomyces sp. NPDC048248 TaxID=3365523 RepID=UPI00371B8E03
MHNSAAVTRLCQDRTDMAALAHRAGLPFAATCTVATLAGLPAEGEPATPLVIKSRDSRRRDLVARVDSLPELAAAWPDEPVVVQEFTENSGWNHELWAVDGQLFAALRRSEVTPGGRGPARPRAVRGLPAGWPELVLRVGEVFGLDLHGVDTIDAGDGAPAFPRIRGQAGAPQALAELALRAGAGAAGARGVPGARRGWSRSSRKRVGRLVPGSQLSALRTRSGRTSARADRGRRAP